jgi:hypothetical protein
MNERLVSRDGSIISRIACATEGLAWDCYRLVTGIRFRREDTPGADLPLFAIAA